MNQAMFLSTQFWWLLSLIVPLVVGIYAHMKVTGTYANFDISPELMELLA